MALISDYGLLGDCHGSALLTRDGSIDWWCPVRFDAPSVFGRLLDADAGYWSIRPAGEYTVERRYLDGSMVIDVAVDLAPRFEYGLVRPKFTATASGIEIAGGADRFSLTGGRSLDIEQASASGRSVLSPGEVVTFALVHHRSTDAPETQPDGEAMLQDTIAGWQSWSELHRSYQGPYMEQVHRSALVLQALTYQPTGAVIAAATTSLPEEIGGTANWDYRFGWLRNGSLTLKALWVAACPDDGQRFFQWMASSAAPVRDGPLQIMFGAGGELDLSEHELNHLRGYAGSRPVRVGNDAWKQRQLDVLGEVLESAWILRDRLGELEPATASFLTSLADRAAETWQEPDSGIWEGREGERNYLTSKLMCWVALDRAVKLADTLGAEAKVRGWKRVREEIRTAIEHRGWDDTVKAFTGAFGSDHLDAGVLLMPIVGFLPGDDERVVATLDAIERNLATDSLVQRWTDAGNEGAFIICSYWLAAGRAMGGQVDRAREIFEAVTCYANDLGLLSEEIDIHERSLIGNFPQALSHIGLINAAWAIAEAERFNQ